MEKKESEKKLGVWMDHAQAYFIKYYENGNRTRVKTINNPHHGEARSHRQGEKMEHNKEQQDQKAYFKSLTNEMMTYDEILLFGPTDAKVELLNKLREDPHFDQKEIHVQQADKMTDNQQQAFVFDFFSPNKKTNEGEQ
ncbi:MAG: hypothetical protein IPO65_12265 [Saprospiraceae bacterium]|nr:hypothetical protein [Saprospiraceae bacterium]